MRERLAHGSAACWRFLMMLGLVLVLAGPGAARVPREINYQGKLTDAQGQPLAGSHSVVFAIYDALSGGTQLWSEARTVNSDSTGVFAVVLGASTPIEVAFTGDAWLQVEVDGKALSPRRPMVSVPYAFNAEAVNGIGASATPAPNSLYP
ncbi:MAG TPA: hypothetical protein VMU02_02980, partial [bacterium]|nr:hypothetical protein [bacterium]